MADNENNSPLIERLAVQRVVAPGVIDRSRLQRSAEQLPRSALSHGLISRLQQRATPVEAEGSARLLWLSGMRRATDVASDSLPRAPGVFQSAPSVSPPSERRSANALASGSPSPGVQAAVSSVAPSA